MNVVRLVRSTFLFGTIGLLLMLIAFTGAASARPHGITIECRDKHHHKVACPSRKHHHKKHHKKSKPAPEAKAETPVAPAPAPAPVSEQPKEQSQLEPELPQIQLETISEVELEEEQVICAHAEAPFNHPVTVHFSAGYGTFANEGEGSAVSSNNFCASYFGPSVLPEGTWPFDFIKATVWDTVTGESNWSIEIPELVGQAH